MKRCRFPLLLALVLAAALGLEMCIRDSHERLGGDAGLLGLVLDRLAVLVGAGEEHHVIAGEALVPGHGVGGQGAVGAVSYTHLDVYKRQQRDRKER